MATAAELGSSVGGIGVGVGSTVLIRRQFDQAGETTILRPSVLWGVGTGVVALIAPWMMNGTKRGMFWEFVEDYGEAALTAGIFSAFNPVGGGVQLPSL